MLETVTKSSVYNTFLRSFSKTLCNTTCVEFYICNYVYFLLTNSGKLASQILVVQPFKVYGSAQEVRCIKL